MARCYHWRSRLVFRSLSLWTRGIEYEQNLSGRAIAVILIRAKSSRLEDLIPHAAEILAAIDSIEPGQVVLVG